MKTPKREQEKCWRCGGNLVVPHGCSGSFCPTCNYYVNVSPRLMEQHARWIRKNREKRLKHALQRQAWNAVMLAADLRCAELSASSWKKRYREIWRMQFWTTSAYGQDVEGS